jgi:magnesium transporter
VLTILQESTGLVRRGMSEELPRDAIWIDLLSPTVEETAFVESQKSVRVPSIEALSEIESSSRLAVEHDAIYLSIPAVAQGDTPDAHLSPTGFILTKSVLITIRFAPLTTFDSVAGQVSRDKALLSATAVFTALLGQWWIGEPTCSSVSVGNSTKSQGPFFVATPPDRSTSYVQTTRCAGR